LKTHNEGTIMRLHPPALGEKVVYTQGWQGTIGLIVPTLFTTHPEHEFRYLFPEGVGLICQRVLLDYPNLPLAEALHAMHDSLPDAAHILKACGADIISFGCTSSSFLKGREYELYLTERIKKASNLPSITVANAVADAIRFLEAKKVLLISPYTTDVNKQLEKYLRDDQKIGLHYVHEIVSHDKSLTPWQQYRVVLDACRASPPGADAIFFSCGATRLVEVIPQLEEETGVPVLSTNLCNVWKCIQALGIRAPIQGKGKLLEIPR
jgi:maleate isomerase